jgi:hypothetical protein
MLLLLLLILIPFLILILLVILLFPSANAGSGKVQFGPPPNWHNLSDSGTLTDHSRRDGAAGSDTVWQAGNLAI